MVRTGFALMRWLGWATLCLIAHPELGHFQDWMDNPGQVVELVGLYFLLGLVLEFAYRKLVWGSITPLEVEVSARHPEFPQQGWQSFVDQRPPEDCPLEILCADGLVRKGKTIATALDGRLIFEIEYGTEIRQLRNDDPMRFAPRYWRLPNINEEKGDSDVF